MKERTIAHHLLYALALLAFSGCAQRGGIEDEMTIDLSAKGTEVPQSLYGIFFEEINHSGDGGLYAEMIQNRGFEDSSVPEGFRVEEGRLYPPTDDRNHLTGASPDPNVGYRWSSEEIPAWQLTQIEGEGASWSLTSELPLNEATPNALEVRVPTKGKVLVENSGYWGMRIEEGKRYLLYFHTSNLKKFDGRAVIKLLASDESELCSRPLTLDNDDQWCRYSGELIPTGSDPRGRFAIELEGEGTLLIDFVSLFPEDTFHSRENGLRKDVAETLENLKPAFVRWPGGCVVEGINLSNRINWKESIGEVAARPGNYDAWGYRTTMGFGYHEFLQFCEDISADAMFVCNVGLGCQGRVGDSCSEEEVDHFIQDALDAIDYALGDGSTEWSGKRVENGHEAPFPLKYVEIGNENWGPVYEKRFDRFYKEIKEKYPDLTLISTLGLGGEERHEEVDMIDPHWYVGPDYFFSSDRLFDTQPRGGHSVYIGEYAVNQGVGSGNLYGALAEAAFLTGVERNSDLVKMASYAPLLENVNDRVWPTNLIWVDTDKVVGRSSYYVQKMYAENRPTYNIANDFKPSAKNPETIGRIGLGGWETDNEFEDLRVILADGTVVQADLVDDLVPQEGDWRCEDGVLKQEGGATMRWSLWDSPEPFGDCTISVKARKTSGREGFLVYFGMNDGLHGYVLNIGGWGNQTTAFQRIDGDQMPQLPTTIPQTIQTGRLYDIKIEVRGSEYTFHLDGEKVLTVSSESRRQFLASGYDEYEKELVIKVVNASAAPYPARINIKGTRSIKGKGKAIVLSSANPTDENSMESPLKVSPEERVVTGVSESFRHEFDPWSFTVLRLKVE